MLQKAVPMIHVPDVGATLDWYASILGFKVIDVAKEDGHANWALLGLGETRLMLSAGGQPTTAHRREVDLYIYVDDVDHLYERIKDRVEVVEGPHDMFYGMHEVIIRDLNRFWITFGQPVRE